MAELLAVADTWPDLYSWRLFFDLSWEQSAFPTDSSYLHLQGHPTSLEVRMVKYPSTHGWRGHQHKPVRRSLPASLLLAAPALGARRAQLNLHLVTPSVGPELMALSCTRGLSGWILGEKISFFQYLVRHWRSCPERRWSHHPWIVQETWRCHIE